MKTSLTEIASLLKASNSVLLFAHENPDGDAIGSMTAAGLALKSLGKRVDYRIGADKGGFYSLLPESSCFNGAPAASYDTALVLDCSTFDFMHDNAMVSACRQSILIDHHDTNTGYADYCYVEADSGATGEIVYNLIKELNAELTQQIADALFISMITDTGNFTFSNTTARTHRIVSELYASFGGFYKIAEYIKINEPQSIEILKVGLDNTEFLANGKMAVAYLLYECGFAKDNTSDTEILTNTLRYMRGVNLAVTIKQTSESTYKVSMRSSEEIYDVSRIAASFNGGGHTKAAGFNFKGDINTLKNYFGKYAEDTFGL